MAVPAWVDAAAVVADGEVGSDEARKSDEIKSKGL